MRPTYTLGCQTSVKKLRDFSHHWNSQINLWKSEGLTNVEKQYAQPFWTDFLACFGINARDTARVRGAILYTMTTEGNRNLSQFVNRAVMAEVERLETKYNNGEPSPSVGAREMPQGGAAASVALAALLAGYASTPSSPSARAWNSR